MAGPVRVLVTGVSGDLGQAIVKALRLSPGEIRCDGCDSDGAGVGAAFVERCAVVPRADDPGYPGALNRLCEAWGIEAVIPASAAEIAALGRNGDPPRLPSGIPVVCQPWPWVERYGDKLRSMDALGAAVPLAPFADGTDARAMRQLVAQAGFPLVVKPRRSHGSRGLQIARNEAELAEALRTAAHPLAQAFLDGESEFSVGAFQSAGWRSLIAFRRRLGPSGCSWFAEVEEDPDVLAYAAAIAQASGLRGSANIQVRKTREGVRLLEINARFSSLVAARAACGFRDAEWSLWAALGRPVPRPVEPYRRLRFQRFFHELVDTGEGFCAVPEWAPEQRPLLPAVTPQLGALQP